MVPPHLLIGVVVGSAYASMAPTFTAIAIVAVFVGGVFSDLDVFVTLR